MFKHGKHVVIILIFMLINVKATNDEELANLDLKPGKPAVITYDGKSLIINGKRELFFSGSIHYPRAAEGSWGELLDKTKAAGINMIQTYIFWNLHEPEKGKVNFEGPNNPVKFIKMIAERGMWVCLRIGPFIQGEWNHGGVPYWLRMEKNITMRTNNEAYKRNMQEWTIRVVNLMKENKLFAQQGGPIMLAQIENEYDHVREAYGEEANIYLKWAADMTRALNCGVPWIMCKSKNAPDDVINTCNGRMCAETFTGPNKPNKPALWTENWTAQYRAYGDPPSQRASEDITYNVARWFSKNGSHVNYYMFYGGTSFGRNSAAFITNRYYDEAPLDEFGLIRGPKYGHIKALHHTLRLCKKALLEGDFKQEKHSPTLETRVFEKGDFCCAFLWNNETRFEQTIKFRGKDYVIPGKSISILPDCKTVAFNSDYMVGPHNLREFITLNETTKKLKWERAIEPFPTKHTVVKNKAQEQFDTAKDTSDYLWYHTTIDLDQLDLPFKKSVQPVILVISLGHSLQAYANGVYIGHGHGSKKQPKFTFEAPLKMKEGVNNLTILSSTVGMPDSGAYLEKRWTGVSVIELQGLGTGNLDLTYNGWQHTVGLEGERMKWYTEEGAKKAKWVPHKGAGKPLSWYKAYFDAPPGNDPLGLNMKNMTKGLMYVNGILLGRYWSSFISPLKKPSQDQYHIPRSYVKPKDNLLVIFEEMDGNIESVSIEKIIRDVVCGSVSEVMPPEPHVWKMDDKGKLIATNDTKPRVTLTCPDHKVITKIEEAQFGNPDGNCGAILPNCTAPNAKHVAEQRCLGKESCIIPVDKALFDKNSCPEAPIKKLMVQARCEGKPT